MRSISAGRPAFLARRSRPAKAAAGLLVVAIVGLASLRLAGQTYSSGQPLWPAFEGWERNDDGTFSFVFGYMNDNWEEQIDVPIGPENAIEPGGPDRGQPTHFQPRRNRFIFRVRVPKDWGQKEMVWTVTSRGVARTAYASLRTDLLIENVDIMSETGALGAGASNPEIRGDKPPAISIVGPKALTAKVGQPVTLTAVVTDDGVPKRRGSPPPPRSPDAPLVIRPSIRVTVGKNWGLHLAWFVYRGAGVRAAPGQDVGGYAAGRQLAVGAGVDGARSARRRQVHRQRDVRRAWHVRAPRTRRRWRADQRPGSNGHRLALTTTTTQTTTRYR
jgi:hypothetical protein